MEAGKVGLCTSPEKCKVLTTIGLPPGMIGQTYRLQVQTLRKLMTSATLVATMLYISYKGSCEKDVRLRIEKATAVFGKMKKRYGKTSALA